VAYNIARSNTLSCPAIALQISQYYDKGKRRFQTKVTITGRTYNDKIKKWAVQEINAGFLTHRAAAKKYVINRKIVDNWVTSEAYNNLRPLEITVGIMLDTTCRKLVKQVMDLTKELEKANLKISGLETYD
jgi:hypothetical protein